MAQFILLQKEVISSGVASVNLENVLTSDYQAYQVTITDLKNTSAGGSYVGLRMLDNTSAYTNANYDWSKANLINYGAFSSSDNQDTTFFGNWMSVYSYPTTENSTSTGTFWIYRTDEYTYVLGMGLLANTSNQGWATKNIGVFKNTGIQDGFQLFQMSVSRYFDSGNICLYGYGV